MPKGGFRVGAGRKKGSKTKLPIEVRREIKEMALQYGGPALATLVKGMKSKSEQARILAADKILDRAYGKPAQSQVHEGGDRPILIEHSFRSGI